MADTDNTIKQIKIGTTTYEMNPKSVQQPLESLSIQTAVSSSDDKNYELTIESTNSSNSADINFLTASTKSVATSGKVSGVIKLNTKGNLAVESLNKHVNIEAKQAIQLKPTTAIIIDTSRRKVETTDNEAVVQVKWDDAGDAVDDEDKYGYLKINAKAIDLRTHDGGVALQPSYLDSDLNENKVKIETSRKKDVNEDAATTDYVKEGGKGIEIFTMNSLHTSLYTRDYRFNNVGKIYPSTRGTVTAASAATDAKVDYPTQGDDFKDIPLDNNGIPCVWDTTNKVWKINTDNTSHGSFIMESTWGDIVKTTNALNTQTWTETKVTDKDNLQIQANSEYAWTVCNPDQPEVPVSRQLDSTVTTPTEAMYSLGATLIWKVGSDYKTITRGGTEGSYTYTWTAATLSDVDSDHDLTSGDSTPAYPYTVTGDVYKVKINNANHYATCSMSVEHHLNIEGDTDVKIQSEYGDVELDAANKVSITSAHNTEINSTDDLQFISESIKLEGTDVSLETSDKVTFIQHKISKKGAHTVPNTKIQKAFINNLGKAVYLYTESGVDKVRIAPDTLYTSNGVLYSPNGSTAKTTVYTDSAATTLATEGFYFVKNTDNNTYAVEVDEEGAAKKKQTLCNNNSDYANVVFSSDTVSGEITVPADSKYIYPIDSNDETKVVTMEDLYKLLVYMKYTTPSGPWA